MHNLWFNLRVRRAVSRDEILDKLQAVCRSLTERIGASWRPH
jgi:hypothetical protein